MLRQLQEGVQIGGLSQEEETFLPRRTFGNQEEAKKLTSEKLLI